MPAILRVTDGTDTASLLRGEDGFYLDNWTPATVQYKTGGTFQSSPLSDGRRLVQAVFENALERFDLKVEGGSEDDVILVTQNLRRLLEKAVDYWTTDWQSEPVWIEAQAVCESNLRYALIQMYSAPTDDNPYAQPFLQSDGTAVLDNWRLNSERGHWLADQPGTGTAVAIGASAIYDSRTLGNVDSSGTPTATTTAQAVYVANKRNTANLSDVYLDDGGAWSANLMDAAVPFEILPAVPAANDALYLGIDTTLANSGPFCSLVFDVGTATTNVTTTVWEYWNGAAWSTLDVQDNTAGDGLVATGSAFDTAGIRSVHWVQPSAWATRDISNDGGPAITGYFVRVRVSAIGVGPTGAAQQNRDIYSIVWPYVEIAAAQVGGDIPALVRINALNQSDVSNNPALPPVLPSSRIITATRLTSRGTNFTPFINLSDEQNPAGISVGVVGSAAFATNVQAPSGRTVVVTNPAAEAQAATITFSSTIVDEYDGSFHMYLRGQQTSGSAGDIEFQVRASMRSSLDALFLETPFVPFDFTNDWQILDFGKINIAAIEGGLVSATASIYIFVRGDGAADAELYDFVLMPIDEFAIDSQSPFTGDAIIGGRGNPVQGIYLRTSKMDDMREIQSIAIRTSDGLMHSPYRIIANEIPILQANARQRVYFLSAREPQTTNAEQRSEPYVSFSITLDKNQRYLSMRGAR